LWSGTAGPDEAVAAGASQGQHPAQHCDEADKTYDGHGSENAFYTVHRKLECKVVGTPAQTDEELARYA
jgi:enolase